MKKKKLFLLIGAVVVVVALVVVNLSMNTSHGITVQADEVVRRDLTEVVSASGRIQPQTKVDITAEVHGEIVGLFVRDGDRVEVGDLLVILDTVQLSSDVDQARYAVNEVNARLAGAKASLDQAKEEFERQARLYESNLTSETQHKNAEYAYRNAKSVHEATQAQAKQLQARYKKQLDYLNKAKIVAPMAGIITFLDCEAGEIASAQTAYTQGKTLMTISNLDIFEVEVEVDETEINKVELYQQAEIEVDAFPDTIFAGKIVEIGNTAITSGFGTQDQSTDFRVKVIIEDPNVKLRPGMSATVDITTAEGKDILAIPYSAMVMRSFNLDSLEKARDEVAESSSVVGDVHAAEVDEDIADSVGESSDEDERTELKGVFVIRDGTARFVEIESGIADQRRIEIKSGLSESDSVISGPYRVLRTIKDGDEVQVEKKKEKKD